jgi:hypothetical protein
MQSTLLLFCCIRFRLLYSYSWPLPHPFLIDSGNRLRALLPYSNMSMLFAPWSIIFVTSVHMHVRHMDIVHGHAACTCSMHMHHGCMNMKRGDMNMQHGHAACIYQRNIRGGCNGWFGTHLIQLHEIRFLEFWVFLRNQNFSTSEIPRNFVDRPNSHTKKTKPNKNMCVH